MLKARDNIFPLSRAGCKSLDLARSTARVCSHFSLYIKFSPDPNPKPKTKNIDQLDTNIFYQKYFK